MLLKRSRAINGSITRTALLMNITRRSSPAPACEQQGGTKMQITGPAHNTRGRACSCISLTAQNLQIHTETLAVSQESVSEDEAGMYPVVSDLMNISCVLYILSGYMKLN